MCYYHAKGTPSHLCYGNSSVILIVAASKLMGQNLRGCMIALATLVGMVLCGMFAEELIHKTTELL